MAGTKGRGQKASKKAHYASYNYEKNRAKKLTKLVEENPNDAQLMAALRNIHYRGPQPSKDKLGWINRFETLSGYVSDKKNDKGHLYEDVTGQYDAKQRAKMAAHVRKVERKHQHDMNFNSNKKSK